MILHGTMDISWGVNANFRREIFLLENRWEMFDFGLSHPSAFDITHSTIVHIQTHHYQLELLKCQKQFEGIK